MQYGLSKHSESLIRTVSHCDGVLNVIPFFPDPIPGESTMDCNHPIYLFSMLSGKVFFELISTLF